MAGERWPRRVAPPPLRGGEVHVWLVRLDVAPERLATLGALLDARELERATRPVYPVLRDRFVAARGTLREMLGAYLGEDAARIRLEYGERGKPRLVSPGAPRLHFNVAHTHDVAMVALALDADVGVDVERERVVDHLRVSLRMFSPEEREALLALPAERQEPAFFECWAFKESYVKARGDGLTVDTTRFDAWRPGGREGDRAPVRGEGVEDGWEVALLRPLPGYPAAVCARGPGFAVVRGEWGL